MTYNIIFKDELSHHGILGQKWGKKNGPPYPLTPSAHSSSEKKAGYTKSIDSASDPKKKKSTPSNVDTPPNDTSNNKLTDEQKDTLKKVGIAVGATALVAVGGYALYKSGAMGNIVNTRQVAQLASAGKTATHEALRKGASLATQKATSSANALKTVGADTAKGIATGVKKGFQEGSEETSKWATKTVIRGLGALGLVEALDLMTPNVDITDTIFRANNNKKIDSFYKRDNNKNLGEDVTKISDAELQKRIKRLQLEKQYTDLMPSDTALGQQYINKWREEAD